QGRTGRSDEMVAIGAVTDNDPSAASQRVGAPLQELESVHGTSSARYSRNRSFEFRARQGHRDREICSRGTLRGVPTPHTARRLCSTQTATTIDRPISRNKPPARTPPSEQDLSSSSSPRISGARSTPNQGRLDNSDDQRRTLCRL